MSSINLLYIFPLSMGSVYGIILAGWASNSKYALLGSFRSVAQMLSYDISLMFSLIPILILTGNRFNPKQKWLI
jgi:NADH-quinone oxidoreductase subunit H